MAVKTIMENCDNCIGCPPELGCIGAGCSNYPREIERKYVVCDACGEAAGELCRAPYQKEDAWVCESCLHEMLEWKGEEDFINGN